MSEEDKAIEKMFESTFGHDPSPFPEGTTLEEKVGMIKKGREAVEAAQSTELKNKMENVANLNKELEAGKEKLAEEARANLERLDEGLKRDGISIEPKEKSEEPVQERTPETSKTDETELNDAKDLQEKAKKTEEPMQEQTAETSKTDETELNDAKGLQEKAKKPEEPVQERTPEAEKIYPILDKNEKFNLQDKEEREQFGKQHGPKTEEKQPDAPLHERQKQPQQQENTQESQEKASIWNRFTHFVKKVLEQLIGEEEHVEYIKNEKETPQKNPSDNNKAQGEEDRVKHVKNEQEIPQKNPAVEHETQEKGMNQISSIEINGEKIDLEPGKNFSYVTNDKTLSINITYTNQPQYEVAQQNNLSSASMNLNINGKGYSIPPGENFSYKNNNVEINVTHGNQQERNYDEILQKAQTLGENLREHGAQMKERANNDFGHNKNTPDVQKSTGGHSR